MEGFSAWDGTAFTQTMIFIPDSAANILNTPSGARAWSREGTGPYSLKSLLQLPSHLNPLGTQLITPDFAIFSEADAHFRQRRISLRLSLKSPRKACASRFTARQLRNQGSIAKLAWRHSTRKALPGSNRSTQAKEEVDKSLRALYHPVSKIADADDLTTENPTTIYSGAFISEVCLGSGWLF